MSVEGRDSDNQPIPSNERNVEGEVSKSQIQIENKLIQFDNACGKAADDVAIYGSYLDRLEGVSKETITSLTSSLNGAISTGNSVYSKFKNVLIIILVFALVLILSIGFYTAIEWPSFITIIIVFILSSYGLFRLVTERLTIQLDELEKQTNNKLKLLNKEHEKLLSVKDILRLELTNTTKNKLDTKSIGNAFFEIAKNHVPLLKEYLDWKERQNNLTIFWNTLRNSLDYYGFSITPPLANKIEKINLTSNSEKEWLNSAVKVISNEIEVIGEIIFLAFYDYTEDTTNLKNKWLEIRNNNKKTAELAKFLIRNNIIDSEYLNFKSKQFGAVEDLIRLEDVFRLDEFKQSFNRFYVELVNEKLSMLEAMQTYHLRIGQNDTEAIRKYVPTTLDANKRRDELIDFVSNRTNVQKDILSLIYHDRIVDTINRNIAWGKIRNDNSLLDSMNQFLIENKLIDVPSNYLRDEGSKKVVYYLSSLLKKLESYSLQNVFKIVHDEFSLLDIEKTRFRIAVKPYNILLGDQKEDELNKWIPNGEDHPRDEIANWISKKSGFGKYSIMLLYYDYKQDFSMRKETFDLIKKTNLANELVDLVLSRKTNINYEMDNNISTNECMRFILDTEPDFDMIRIQGLLHAYSQILEQTRNIFDYLEKEEMIPSNSEFDAFSMLSSVNGKLSLSRLEIMIFSFDTILQNNGKPSFHSQEWKKAICSASSVLFTIGRQDILQTEACKYAAINDSSCKILYKFVEMREKNEEFANNQPIKLSQIITMIQEEESCSYEYIINFKEALLSGLLFPKIRLLNAAVLNDILHQMRTLGDGIDLENTLDRDLEAVRNLLNSELNFDLVLRSLTMQLVNAYMITTTSEKRVLSTIIDVEMPKICKKLADDDSRFHDFLMLTGEIGKATSGGRYTRLGIVPFGIPFDEFNILFNDAFNLAVKEYKSANGNVEGDYSANIVRVFPSDAFFRRIDTNPKNNLTNEDHPVNVVKKLIIGKYRPLESLEILASLQTKDSKTVAMRNVLLDLINNNSSIVLISKDNLCEKLGKSKIVEALTNRDFDHDLIAKFNRRNLTDLASLVYTNGIGSDIEGWKENYSLRLAEVVKNLDARLDSEQLRNLSNSTYDALFGIGLLFNGLKVHQ